MELQWSRRESLKSAITGLTCALLSPPSLAHPKTGMSSLDMFRRLRCSDFGRKTFWQYSGTLFGDRYGEPMRPLFSMQGASQTMASQEANGDIRYDLKEAGYYGDLATGEIINGEVANVFTDEWIRPEHYLSSQELFFTRNLEVIPTRPLPRGISFDGRIARPDIKGDRIWMAEYLFVSVEVPDAAPRISNSMANFEASVSDVERPSGFVPATMQYTTFNSYRRWMNMGETQGHVMMRLNALKLDSWSKIPTTLRQRIEHDHESEFGDD